MRVSQYPMLGKRELYDSQSIFENRVRNTESARTATYEIAGLDKRLRRWAQNTAVRRFELDVKDASMVRL